MHIVYLELSILLIGYLFGFYWIEFEILFPLIFFYVGLLIDVNFKAHNVSEICWIIWIFDMGLTNLNYLIWIWCNIVVYFGRGFEYWIGLILDVDLGLHIKIGFGLWDIKFRPNWIYFDLLYLGLINCTCILVINWEILHYVYQHVRYFCWGIFANLGIFF